MIGDDPLVIRDSRKIPHLIDAKNCHVRLCQVNQKVQSWPKGGCPVCANQ